MDIPVDQAVRTMPPSPQTLYEKLWSSHVVKDEGDGVCLLYIDRHLLHEVSTPQAFEGLRAKGLGVRRPSTHLAVADHAVPTRGLRGVIADPQAAAQIALLEANCQTFDIAYIPLEDLRQGIVHVIGPELGFTQPGMTLVCGDSHTATHGAFGALAFGIGASECETVLATNLLRQTRAKNMSVRVTGAFASGVSAKDLILDLIGRLGVAGAAGYAVEYSGPTISRLSMAGRMTICNMTIEAGSRIGLIAPDETTYAWLADRPRAPKGCDWERALAAWRHLPTDQGAIFDRVVEIDAGALAPQVTWGTSPDQVASICSRLPDPEAAASDTVRLKTRRALDYMDLKPGQTLENIAIDRVFIGSCTNSRIEDLRSAAKIARGRTVAKGVGAIVVPGSGQVKRQAEAEGLDVIFTDAGFEWREPGCSLCVAMNDDRLEPGQRCASTSNRNFEGRQGPGARTHLMSPAMAAAAAVAGHLIDVRKLIG
jgi:3-isopropylmalate/(R)-2-methylmalate dehydratase large subunit